MASKAPTIRKIAWVSMMPQIAFLGLLCFSFYYMGMSSPLIWAAGIYIMLSFGLKYLFARNHRNGIFRLQKEEYEQAFGYFQKSHDFFAKHEWMDKFRYLTLLSASKMWYREMALVNMAFCRAMQGKGAEAKELYEETLKFFPENSIARTALKFMEAGRGEAGEK